MTHDKADTLGTYAAIFACRRRDPSTGRPYGPSEACKAAADALLFQASFANWQPTPANIKTLPAPLRAYIHFLHTDADPAGTIRENYRLRAENEGLRTECERLASEANSETRHYDPIAGGYVKSD